MANVDVDRLIQSATKLVMHSTGEIDVIRLDPPISNANLFDGEEIHTELREALGIPFKTWDERPGA